MFRAVVVLLASLFLFSCGGHVRVLQTQVSDDPLWKTEADPYGCRAYPKRC